MPTTFETQKSTVHTTMNKQSAKYEVITEYIKDKIDKGSLKPGDKVPSENALTNKFSVSRDTVRRAFKALEDEGILISRRGSGTYVRLRKTSSNRIAVITTYLENYIFPKIILGIESYLSEKGYAMQLSFTNNLFEREREVLMDVLERGDVAGLIMEPVMSALPNPNLKLYDEFKNRGIPVLFINSFYRELDVPHVSIADEELAYRATKYLIEKGHRRIGAILKMDDGQGHLRFSGFQRAMLEIGEKTAFDYVAWYDTSDERASLIYGKHLDERLKTCSAVFCYNDKVAREYISHIAQFGLKVPENVSVIGMDDSDMAKIGDMKLTTIPHPLDELGRTAAENLLKLIENPKFDATKEFVTDVIERDSVINKE